jgi:hypothetical protein
MKNCFINIEREVVMEYFNVKYYFLTVMRKLEKDMNYCTKILKFIISIRVR